MPEHMVSTLKTNIDWPPAEEPGWSGSEADVKSAGVWKAITVLMGQCVSSVYFEDLKSRSGMFSRRPGEVVRMETG